MLVGLHAGISDTSTQELSTALHPVFLELSTALGGDYGGKMEHLWIDLELVESLSRPDCVSRYAFRFQKRVSGRTSP